MLTGTRMNPKDIRELMRLRGWTQRELARRMEVNEATVSKWLSGENDPMGPCRVLLHEWLIDAREAKAEKLPA